MIFILRPLKIHEARAFEFNAGPLLGALSYAFHGTGSYPPGCQGWHRSSLFTNKINPRAGPCLLMAVSAYAEQLGMNRQLFGKTGENNMR